MSTSTLSKLAKSRRRKMDEQSVAEISSDDDATPMEESLSYKYIYGDIEFPSQNLKCLEDKQYLSDSIVQFYLAYLINGCDKKLANRVHIFDSMIMKRLEPVFSETLRVVPQLKLKKLTRWLTNVDMFQKDYIIYPICSEQHWFVVVVCYPMLVEEFEKSHYDRYEKKKKNMKILKSPGFIVMDSLACKAKRYTAMIRDFLDYDWRSRGQEECKRFSDYDIVSYYPKLPTQSNSYDCGIYILAYIRAFLENPDEFYQCAKTKSSQAEEKLASEMRKSLEMVTRDSIKTLIRQICESNIRSK